jgi:hypothetical protein
MGSFHSRYSSKVAAGILALLWVVLLYPILIVTRIDPLQQMAQKIFYYHVPSAWGLVTLLLCLPVSSIS